MKTEIKRTGTANPQVSERELRNDKKARTIAAEGMVLLKNDGVLPLDAHSSIALYGYGAKYTIKGGTGSGDVAARHVVSVYEGLKNAGFTVTNEEYLYRYDIKYQTVRKEWEENILRRTGSPIYYRKLYYEHASNPLIPPKGLAGIEKSSADIALYVISRISGEFADRKNIKGDYLLSEDEAESISLLSRLYPKVVLILNVGGVVDLSILDEVNISAVILMGQAGSQGGNALADILTGQVNPSGRLTDSWAYRYGDYPNSATFSHNNGNVSEEPYTEGIYVGYRYFDSFEIPVRFPFGYGLSYTDFEVTPGGMQVETGSISVMLKIQNTGNCLGKYTALLFASCPDARYDKERRRLVAFGKTPLLAPNEICELSLSFPVRGLRSYHAGRSEYYMEAGEYYIFYGGDIANLKLMGALTLSDNVILEKLKNICPLNEALKTILPDKGLSENFRNECHKRVSGLSILSIDDIVPDCQYADYNGDRLPASYKDDKIWDMIKHMSLYEKASLVCGRLKDGVGDTIGSASASVPGAAGETIVSLYEKYGLKNIVMADGPAGLRLTTKYQLDDAGQPIILDQIQKLLNRCFGHDFIDEHKTTYYQYTTALPVGTLLAQSFDCRVWDIVGEVVADELKEFNINLWLAPGMNIHRNPLCGRNYEYYSEDPYLTGMIAAEITKSIQKDPSLGVTLKHFACNNQEENRMHSSSLVTERALREIYLTGFEIAVRESGPAAIMTSYNKLNGLHTANSYDLCTAVARLEWGFDGIFMTDWQTTNNGGGSSAAKCMTAGNDLVMPGKQGDIKEIIDAVNCEGDLNLDEKHLDACVYRIIRAIFRLCGK